MTALNFPANPTNGQTYENYVYDGTDGVWKRISPGGTLGNIDDVTINAPADGESLVYDSATGDWINADATVEVYGVDTAATDYFMIPVGGDADRPVAPANGHIRFNSDSGEPEWYSTSLGEWIKFRSEPTITYEIDYLVIGGGGSGGHDSSNQAYSGSGGGAGGYRTSFETSGRNSTPESNISINTGTSYFVSIGAGGAGLVDLGAVNGSDTVFASITSLGGGGGGGVNSANSLGYGGGNGGSGGGNGGLGTTGQGFDGGNSGYPSGGGGAGANGGSSNGGAGLASTITGSSVFRAGGGGGTGTGGAGGGGNVETAGQANTGGGGGGRQSYGLPPTGGSGIVILRYPSELSLNAGPGIVSPTTITIGNEKVTQILGGADNISFSKI